MLGLLLYTFVALGAGAWVPTLKLGDARSLGATILGGYAVTLLALFLFHVILRLPLNVTAGLIIVASVAGWVRMMSWLRDHRILFSPGFVLPALAALAIGINGGIDYLPYTVDEFTNWIGVSREIYLHGGYEAIRETVAYPGYLPGWRLLLPLPWVVGGNMDMGQSATAPFVFHVGLVTLVFEVVRHEASRYDTLGERQSLLLAWGVGLLYLAAEGTGKLWTYDLLIEQPQIYAFTACLLYLYLLDGTDVPAERVLPHIGLAVVAGYLLKAAMLTFVPGLLVVLAVLLFRAKVAPWPRRFAGLLSKGMVLLGPTVIVVVLWKGIAPESAKGCMSNPLATLTPDAIAKIAELDWWDLLVRLAKEVGGYVASYKPVVLLAAAGGAAAALMRGRGVWLVAFSAFAAVYFTALYWYHLTCFGPYYFETLNSIPRFSRVVVQPFHAVGLVALALAALHLIARGSVASVFKLKSVWVAAVAACALLLSWQAVQLGRSAEDVTTRRYQSVDPRIAEVRAAANFVRSAVPTSPRPPLVQFISQGTDADLLGYARMYALDGTRGLPRVLFRSAPSVSWNRTASINVWQRVASDEKLSAIFRKANIIWPVIVDPFITRVLLDLAPSPDCADNLVEKVLVKAPNGTFACLRKPGEQSVRGPRPRVMSFP